MRDKYIKLLLDENEWLEKAKQLISAAELLEPRINDFWKTSLSIKNGEPYSFDYPDPNHVYFMLIAFALENFFKAIIIHQNKKEWAHNDILPATLKKHDLIKLADEAFSSDMRFALDSQEKELLLRLFRNSVWAGRYPVPINSEDLKSTKKIKGDTYFIPLYQGDDIGRIKGLLNHVKAFVSFVLKKSL